MRIVRSDVNASLQRYISGDVVYAEDPFVGLPDEDQVYVQVARSTLTSILLNPSVPYDLILQGMRPHIQLLSRASSDLSDIMTTVAEVSTPPQNMSSRIISTKRLADRALTLLANQGMVPVAEIRDTVRALAQFPGTSLRADMERVNQIQDLWLHHRQIIDELLESIESAIRGPVDLQMSLALLDLEGENHRLVVDQLLEISDRMAVGDISSTRDSMLDLITLSVLSEEVRTGVEQHYQVPDSIGTYTLALSTEDSTPPSDTSSSGPFTLPYRSSLVLETDSSPAETIEILASDVPTLESPSDPTAPAGGEPMFLGVRYDGGWGEAPFPANIVDPGYGHGIMEITGDYSEAMAGYLAVVVYRGDRNLLTAAQLLNVEANEGKIYRVVRCDASVALATPQIQLDPVLPYGTAASVPLSDWEVRLLLLTSRWEPPLAGGGYKTTFLTQLQGPASGASDDVLQPWRIYTKLVGTIVGAFVPGERIFETGTGNEGVALYQSGASTLYTHEFGADPVGAEVYQGRISGATVTINVSLAHSVADLPSNSGQTNTARWFTATTLATGYYMQARTVLGSGASASITGSALTLSLGAGERGFYELGMWNGSSVTVDGTLYVIDVISSNSTATIVGTATVPASAWSAPVPKKISRIQVSERGYIYTMSKHPTSSEVSIQTSEELQAATTTGMATPSSDNADTITVEKVLSALEPHTLPINIQIVAGKLAVTGNDGVRSITWGAGTAQAILGLPVSSISYGVARQLTLMNGSEVADPYEDTVSPEDDLQFGDASTLTVHRIDTEVIRVAETVSFSQEGVSITARRKRTSRWASFSRLAQTVLDTQDTLTSNMDAVQYLLAELLTDQLDPSPAKYAELQQAMNYVLSAVAILEAAVTFGDIPPLSETGEILETLQDVGYNQVALDLSEGRFTAVFVDGDSSTSSRAGKLQGDLAEVASHLGRSSDPSRLDDDEEPTAVFDEFSFEDEETYQDRPYEIPDLEGE